MSHKDQSGRICNMIEKKKTFQGRGSAPFLFYTLKRNASVNLMKQSSLTSNSTLNSTSALATKSLKKPKAKSVSFETNDRLVEIIHFIPEKKIIEETDEERITTTTVTTCACSIF